MRILVVDDDPTYRVLVERAVVELGHQATSVADGDAAWASFEADRPDVVISDRRMPGLDGLELVRRIREHPEGASAYVILVTGQGGRSEVVAGMEAGADDYLTKPLDLDELAARLIAAARVTTLHRALAANRAKLEVLNLELAATARRDTLTGLGNRLALQEDVAQLRARLERSGSSALLVLVDVDHFKAYNDTQGHLGGDQVLRTVAQALRTGARQGDGFYRYGGEEFLCVFPEGEPSAAERLRVAVEDLHLAHPGSPLGVVTISAGVARLLPDDLRPTDDVLREADEALYRAKAGGRNQVVSAQPQA